MQGLARLGGTGLPVSGYRMSTDATGMALGYSGGVGRWQAVAARGARERDVGGAGISGWNPETVLAASFSPRSPNRAVEAPGTDTFGVAFASELHRPMGWRGSGPSGSGATASSLPGDATSWPATRFVSMSRTV